MELDELRAIAKRWANASTRVSPDHLPNAREVEMLAAAVLAMSDVVNMAEDVAEHEAPPSALRPLLDTLEDSCP